MDPLKAQKIADAIAGIAEISVSFALCPEDQEGDVIETLEARRAELIKLLVETPEI